MRSIIVPLMALAFATAARAAGPGAPVGPYTLDDQGKCRAANGELVTAGLCPQLTSKHCRDPKGRIVKCPVGCSPSNLGNCANVKPD